MQRSKHFRNQKAFIIPRVSAAFDILTWWLTVRTGRTLHTNSRIRLRCSQALKRRPKSILATAFCLSIFLHFRYWRLHITGLSQSTYQQRGRLLQAVNQGQFNQELPLTRTTLLREVPARPDHQQFGWLCGTCSRMRKLCLSPLATRSRLRCSWSPSSSFYLTHQLFSEAFRQHLTLDHIDASLSTNLS